MARVIREAVNFSTNRSSVLYNTKYEFSSALPYGALAMGILVREYAVTYGIDHISWLESVYAKLLKEAIFFLGGGQVRNRFVLKRTPHRER